MNSTEVKHTPGPWTMKALKARQWEISGPGWTQLAIVNGNITPTTHAEGIANANLIIAAPDLLDALPRVLAMYESALLAMGQDRAAFNASSEVVAARAAILKAEGGSH